MSARRVRKSKKFKARSKNGLKLERAPTGQYVMSWHNQLLRVFNRQEDAVKEYDRCTK